jgi:dihydropyrimidinase
MFDLVITDGHIVTPDHEGLADVGIVGERIAAIGEPGALRTEGARTINARDRYVLPGGIETHAHIHEIAHPGWTGGREVWLQGPTGASRAAAFGGTTTIVSFAFMGVHGPAGVDPLAAVRERDAIFTGNSYVDYAFNPAIVGAPPPELIANIGSALRGGAGVFKVFTTDVTTEQHGVRIPDGHLADVMAELALHGGMLMVHAEQDDLVLHMEAKLAAAGTDQWTNLHIVHSSLSEELAFGRVIRLAREAGTAVFFAHVTGRSGADAIRAARADGRPIYGEVLHNYLCFTAADYDSPDGSKIQTYPALKTDDDQASLWKGLVDGSLTVVATDEYTTDYATKVGGKTVQTACGGHAGIETRGIIAFSEGVCTGRMSLRRFVEVFATAPAKVMGLHPRKGVLAPGADADITIWDPHVQRTITMDHLHHDGDYSIWEGWNVTGWPITTISRGSPVVLDGELVGSLAHGRWQPRFLQPDVLRGPAA